MSGPIRRRIVRVSSTCRSPTHDRQCFHFDDVEGDVRDRLDVLCEPAEHAAPDREMLGQSADLEEPHAAASIGARQQATTWPGVISASGGCCVRHWSVASGQREAKWHPVRRGPRRGDGSLDRRQPVGGGVDPRNCRHQANCGAGRRRGQRWSCVAYLTTTSSQVSATTPRSWVTSLTAAPIRSRKSVISSKTCARIVTSSDVVGSSAISRPPAGARAPVGPEASPAPQRGPRAAPGTGASPRRAPEARRTCRP